MYKSKRKPTSYGLEPLNAATGRITQSIFKKSEGFLSTLILDWHLILGDTLSQNFFPSKVSFLHGKQKGGTLHIQVSSGSHSMMAYHMQPLILEKINRFYGYEAFNKLSISQTKGFELPKTSSPKSYTLTSEEKASILQLTYALDEGDLKNALDCLGQSLLERERQDEG